MASNSFSQKVSQLSKSFDTFTTTKFIPTGSLILDIVMGGGLPEGKMIELASDAGAGKTTIVLSLCRELLRNGKKVVYLDHEGAITTSQLAGTGVLPYLYSEDNPEGTFALFQLMTYGDAEEVLDEMVNTEDLSLIVVDSVTSMIDDSYLVNAAGNTKDKSTSITDIRPAEDARLLGKFVKKAKSLCTKYHTSMILINQLRTNLNITGGMSTKISTGGAAIEFFPDIRLRLEKPKIITAKRKTLNGVEDTPIGCEAIIYAYKNKMTNGKIKVPITIIYGKGISNINSYKSWLPNKMTQFEGEEVPMLITKGGGYNTLTLNGTQYQARGEENLNKLITEHFEEIRKCFGPEDFAIVKDEDYAEFKADNGRTMEITPEDEFEIANASGWEEV